MNPSIPMIKLIEAMNDKPIAFNPIYVKIGCGINGALMLSQLVYWTSRTKNKDGWIYKDHHDWTMETGLTRKEQHTARKTLKELGFISEKKHGVPPRVYFRVERENLYKALIKYSESLAAPQMGFTVVRLESAERYRIEESGPLQIDSYRASQWLKDLKRQIFNGTDQTIPSDRLN